MLNGMSIDIMLLHLFNLFLLFFPFLFFFFVLHKTCEPGNWYNVCMQIISASKWLKGRIWFWSSLFFTFFSLFIFLLLAQIKTLHYVQNCFCNSKVQECNFKNWNLKKWLTIGKLTWQSRQEKHFGFFDVKAVVYLTPRVEIAKTKATTNKHKLLIILEV